MISAQPDFVPQEQVKVLLDFVQSELGQEMFGGGKDHGDSFWDNRFINVNNIITSEDPRLAEVGEIMRVIHGRLRRHIKLIRNIDNLYSDTYQLIRWPVGVEQPPHADKENKDGSEHPYPWRDFASIVYLNDDYQGGHTYFPEIDIDVKPRSGEMVTFPGTNEFLHGVSKVTEKTRYTIAGFWTQNPTYADLLSK